MQGIRLSENVVPVSEFKTKAAEWLARIQRGETVVITQNGKAAGVVLPPQVFDEMSERLRFIQSVEQGIADADAGRTVPHAAVVADVGQRYGRR
jgi:prevent-host-death family protein